ncbi:hypothetical protein FRB94_014110 [Tulasnella sp. JGI-2019a]|nr:hypothetical protein FRB94_014110 [Tulasnella sp. JGI-2019a]
MCLLSRDIWPGISTPVPLPPTISTASPPAPIPNAIDTTSHTEGIVNAGLLQDQYEAKGNVVGRESKRKAKLAGIEKSVSPASGGDQDGNGGQGGNGVDQYRRERDGQPSGRGKGGEGELCDEGSNHSRDHEDHEDDLDLEPHFTPDLKPDLSFTSEMDMDMTTSLELYRSLLRKAGVLFHTVDPEEMDRIVYNLTAGPPLSSKM